MPKLTDAQLYPPCVAVWNRGDETVLKLAEHEYSRFVKALKDGIALFEGEGPDGDDVLIVMGDVVCARKMTTEHQVLAEDRGRQLQTRQDSDLP